MEMKNATRNTKQVSYNYMCSDNVYSITLQEGE